MGDRSVAGGIFSEYTTRAVFACYNLRMNANYQSIITLEAGKRSGKATIRGMRITVYDVLSYLASGMTVDEILADFPYLTAEDIQACLSYAHQA